MSNYPLQRLQFIHIYFILFLVTSGIRKNVKIVKNPGTQRPGAVLTPVMKPVVKTMKPAIPFQENANRG